ncbi:MAG: hypothetical protein COV72_05345 [Candidatus Omnitrophica bacterium CG11_big_fil_rev_8_21_14_0_20_42_13]|uniref:3-deoxy-D-manno-octulosonic acid transferase n=1 Tax=Candidatus Ghiorseimicrobium undicola TaxID=1974746 RepID=A0A2H0LXG3_9BACT|nr:MAG: hypothetical protein COV72_05345 [Candidatus Omnitrophica bacterium CG11_big_fil_rev_8_21_14_0_20_42_13]
MPILYDIVFIFFSIFYLPVMLLKGKMHKGILKRFYLKRDIDFGACPIWVHAVSVGEVKIAALIIRALRKKTGRKIILSTITLSGNNLARKILGTEAEVIYAPVDISFIVNRFIKIIKPFLFIIIETELWPNMISALKKNNVPVVLLNGRISPPSFYGYNKVKFITRGILSKMSLFCMQTGQDSDKIIALGANPANVKVTGNMKFDAGDYAHLEASRAVLNLHNNERLWIAASTHDNEEEIVLRVYKRLSVRFPDLRLFIAPRHIERVEAIEKIIESCGLEASRFSADNFKEMPRSVIILDTIGQLSSIYKFAYVVFVGGSLVKKGGQNIIEPAYFQKPIVFGRYMFNFTHIASLYLKNNAAIEVADEGGLEEALCKILYDADYAKNIGIRAKRLISENQGATERNLNLISQLMRP